MQRFSPVAEEKLKYYVYTYSHPETREVFYVGKGKGNRVFQHLDDTTESEKVRIIQGLRAEGKEPVLEILIHNLETSEIAQQVEAAVIDALGIKNLSNIQRGWHSGYFGRTSVERISALYQPVPATISEPSILFRINQLFRPEMNAKELYNATRGIWRGSLARAKQAELAFAVFRGVVYEVYSIHDWSKATSGFTLQREHSPQSSEKRYEFIGTVAPEHIREKYLNCSVAHLFNPHAQNSFAYVNV